uniref:Nucleotide exchange factor SIL1 n=1 Tax=Erpetoichthys calabaricus TaxID=27687 RepID=A0A8C4SBQ7_ERPCA
LNLFFFFIRFVHMNLIVWINLTVHAVIPVPAGSHVRLNLQTGEREAKLPDSIQETTGLNRKKVTAKDSNSFSAQELKEALKKLKEEAISLADEVKTFSFYFHCLIQLCRPSQSDLEDLSAMMETDFQVMTRLVQQFNNSQASLEEKVTALLDLEYLVHQVDNAQDLISLGGLQLIINTLNSSEPILQEHAAFVLGSAVSSNPRVQVEAMEGGALQKLLLLLGTDQPLPVKKKALFALASLLRHFPFAQQHFLKLGGLQVLTALFRSRGSESLRVRVVTLLYDMIIEKSGLDAVPDASHEERLRQYSQVALLPLLSEQGWCNLVPELLASPEHDMREKALRSILVIMTPCRDFYRQDSGLASFLTSIQEQYTALAESEREHGEDDGYFGELLALVESVLGKLR